MSWEEARHDWCPLLQLESLWELWELGQLEPGRGGLLVEPLALGSISSARRGAAAALAPQRAAAALAPPRIFKAARQVETEGAEAALERPLHTQRRSNMESTLQ